MCMSKSFLFRLVPYQVLITLSILNLIWKFSYKIEFYLNFWLLLIAMIFKWTYSKQIYT